MEPTFKIGDLVTFELSSGYMTGTTPRWNYNTDLGESNIWITGTVATSGRHVVSITFLYPNGDKDCWGWPLPGSPKYSSNQWDRPGYLRHLRKYDILLCEGAEVISGTNI